MKKVLLALALTGAFALTSCKKDAEAVAETTEEVTADVADTTTEAVDSAMDAAKGLMGEDFVMPEFANAELGTWATSLMTTATGMKAASASGNQEELTTLTEKLTALGSTELAAFKEDPDFAKATELFTKVKEILTSM